MMWLDRKSPMFQSPIFLISCTLYKVSHKCSYKAQIFSQKIRYKKLENKNLTKYFLKFFSTRESFDYLRLLKYPRNVKRSSNPSRSLTSSTPTTSGWTWKPSSVWLRPMPWTWRSLWIQRPLKEASECSRLKQLWVLPWSALTMFVVSMYPDQGNLGAFKN